MTTAQRTHAGGIHPLHALVLSGVFPLFLGAALSDYAYTALYHIQWSTFASWMIAGALVFNGFAMLCALVGLLRAERRGPYLVYFLLLLATWILGFINALVHARDAWGAIPTGFVLSLIVAVLACVATLLGFSRLGAGGRP